MPTRRTFLKHAAAGSLAAVAAPAVRSVALQPPGGAAPPIVGSGEHQYEAIHQWLRLPDKYSWQTTHNIAVDSQGLVYVIHEGRLDQPEHPAIFVFDADGAFVRAFGNQFQGGGHGLDVHREGSEEFLYVTAYKEKRSFAKLTLRGETVWHKSAPIEAGRYRAGEEALEHPGGEWLGRDRFLPTNFAFHPEGGFFLADGYGAYCVHRYDADANYVSTFGKPSDEAKADGTFDTPHGIWLDGRAKPQAVGAGPVEPQLVVTDRA
ncbi:MAG TPA: twin-arginine translocation signal domain-containing protein, partial [Lacipirellulaceae bacterium]|nr:twin-arginine translocation signal domain-containing protein [Lacipirellulaceae bacterium]